MMIKSPDKLMSPVLSPSYVDCRDGVYSELLRFAVAANTNGVNSNSIVQSVNSVNHCQPSLQRLIPLIRTQAVEQKIFELLKPNIQAFLSMTHHSQSALQLAYRSQLASTIKLCVDAQIPIVLLKGAALNGTVYSQSAFRSASDIDIWIAAEHWERAETIFRKHMKYQTKANAHVFGDLYELTFVPQHGSGFEIDLHSHLTHPQLFTIDYPSLFATRQAHPLYNKTYVSVLSPEYAIIHQAVHAYNDMDFLKYNLCDTYMLIVNTSIDWRLLVKHSKRCATGHIVFILLSNVSSTFNLNLPNFVLDELMPNSIFRKIGAYLLASKHSNVAHGKTLAYRLHQVASQYVFTRSFIKPLKLQVLYLYKRLKQVLK